MFGSEIALTIAIREVKALDEVVDLGGRVVGMEIIPPGVALPAFAVYVIRTEYPDQGLGGDPYHELVWVVIKGVCSGTSIEPIKAAARAQLAHFADYLTLEEFEGEHYQVSFDRESEVPEPMMVTDGTQFWRQIGTMYRVEITRGG